MHARNSGFENKHSMNIDSTMLQSYVKAKSLQIVVFFLLSPIAKVATSGVIPSTRVKTGVKKIKDVRRRK